MSWLVVFVSTAFPIVFLAALVTMDGIRWASDKTNVTRRK